MDRHSDESKSVDPKSPHAFVERPNVPYNIPRSAGVGEGTFVEMPFRNAAAHGSCDLCDKRRSNPIHAAGEQAAANENWPV